MIAKVAFVEVYSRPGKHCHFFKTFIYHFLLGAGEKVSDEVPVEVRPLLAGVREIEHHAVK